MTRGVGAWFGGDASAGDAWRIEEIAEDEERRGLDALARQYGAEG